ncbi:outer membrane protein assembly factor BamD [Agarilytica rhodophyticola]|uniref:outer membrane protein assembly factor BamD n=1 Tax=Agarilytica rhodophyticola TaxID=1737490 RepID=UPI000B343B21|nr:outer membrane protein assembly factor BamD [Agarilytica rhodophyticola]
MRIINKLVVINFCFLFCFLIAACSSNDDKDQVSTEQAIYENAQKLLRNRNWSAAVETLQLLEENFPFGAYAEQAQLELIYAHFRSNDHDLAIAAAERFIRLHPQHRSVDYAYYMRGAASFYNETPFTTALISDVSTRDSGSARESFNYFSQLLSRYPKSVYVLDARQRMIYLRNVLARQEIHVANYYFRRGAFVAAANRGKFVVENMQQTPAVPDGLAVMAQAYHLLGMQDLADDSAKVLADNYPQHPALDENGNFNYRYKIQPKRSWLSYLTFGLLDKRQFVKFDSRDVFNPKFDEALNPDNAAKPPRSSI